MMRKVAAEHGVSSAELSSAWSGLWRDRVKMA
jgi:hypothetical protein